MAFEVLIRNDNVIEVKNVKNSVTGAPINNATVQVTVRNARGETIEGQTWPYTVPYVALSAGLYRGILDDAMKLPPGVVTVDIDVDGGAGNKANRVVTARAKRGSV